MNYTSKAFSVMVEMSEKISVLFIYLHIYLHSYHILQELKSFGCFHKIVFRFMTFYIIASE